MEKLSRRTVLRWAGGAGAMAVVEHGPFGLLRAAGSMVADAAGPPITYRLVRAGDQLDIVIGLIDATLAADVVSPTGANPIVLFTFGSQHVAERGYTATVPTVSTAAIASFAAGPSVIAVPLTDPVPFTVDDLLALADSGDGVIGESVPSVPNGLFSALEIPAGLILSPASGTRMRGPATPRSVDDVTEVWVGSLENGDGSPVEIYAVQNLSATNVVTARVPDATTRDRLVANTTDIAPLTSSRLWLSSSGAFGKLRGDWTGATLARYRHDLTSGRDLVAQAATTGYLLPFGHRVTVTTITERTWANDTSGGQVSVLQLRRYLDILAPTVTMPRTYEPDGGRGLPFVEITASASESTAITLATVNDTSGTAINGVNDLRVVGTGADLMIQYDGVDRAGNHHTFDLPATFIADSVAYRTSASAAPRKLIAATNTPGRAARRTIDLGGQPLAFADPVGDASSVTKSAHVLVLKLTRPIVGATQSQLTAAQMPGVVASLESATIIDDSVSGLTGSPGAAVTVFHHPRWLSFGNASSNFDLSFLRLDVPAVGAIGAGLPVEGVATLELTAEVFNQTSGVGMDLPTAGAQWDPATALGSGAKIFGSITLADIIDLVAFDVNEIGFGIPGTTVTVDGTRIVVEFTYKPTLKSAEALGFIATPQTRCCVIITTTASIDGSTDPTVRTEMTVSDFFFVVPPFAPAIELDFAKVSAIIETGKPVEVIPEVRAWSFAGVLSFLTDLGDLFNSVGIGIDLEIRTDALELGGSAGLPSFNLGIVEVSNISVHLGIVLPLDGGPVCVTAGLGSKKNPIDVSVAMFGGTFWLELEMKFGDVPDAISFVGIGIGIYWEAFDLNLIIFKASLTLMLSADFALENGDVTFTGAVALIGEIELLGLASASASIVGSLTYTEADETIVLRGTIHYEIDSIFGGDSGTVALGSHTFPVGNGSGGAGLRSVQAAAAASPSHGLRAVAPGPPAAFPLAPLAAPPPAAPHSSFGDHYSTAQWTEYCNAFF